MVISTGEIAMWRHYGTDIREAVRERVRNCGQPKPDVLQITETPGVKVTPEELIAVKAAFDEVT